MVVTHSHIVWRIEPERQRAPAHAGTMSHLRKCVYFSVRIMMVVYLTNSSYTLYHH